MAASHRNMTVDDVSYPDSLTLFALTWVLRYFAQFLFLFLIMNDIELGMGMCHVIDFFSSRPFPC